MSFRKIIFYIIILINSFVVVSAYAESIDSSHLLQSNLKSSRPFYSWDYLYSGRPISGNVRYHRWKFFRIKTNGKKHIKVYLSGLRTDLDLYVKRNGTPNQNSYDCRPYWGGTSAETCSLDVVRASVIYIAVHGYSSGNGRFILKANLTGDNDIKSKPKAIGDIVARDLNIPMLGTFGHLGFWDGSKVMQVMNQPGNVIQKASLTSFINGSQVNPHYWGARYGRGSYRTRLRAIQAGWRQRQFRPEYTTSFSYREGKKVTRWRWIGWWWKRVTEIVPAKFRCDTFVLYSYRKAGLNLYTSTPTPTRIFNSMPRKRG